MWKLANTSFGIYDVWIGVCWEVGVGERQHLVHVKILSYPLVL